ncbi:MAG: tRNA (adenosine(37)-N6)-threonylcarbamoyltransferase complex transferase subunit TsaD [Syntrophorhabdales bacterium]|jgi:N6-L-threonylcarbamoyladenine synthase
MIILGIDTSCDDTSVAVTDGTRVLANIVSSQVPLHRLFGGVVPEIASRKHVELIDAIYGQALSEAGLVLKDVDVLAVTAGPGLIGSLLVGLCFMKGLALSTGKRLVGVNHVEAHAMGIFVERDVEFPFLALIVSGGHTVLLHFPEPCKFRVLGSTRDDAAGEAFDKIAKFLSLGYPGGSVIEELSRAGDPAAVFFPRPMANEANYDFSFSGLKTAFINHVKKYGITNCNRCDLLSSFQEAAFDVLSLKTLRAAREAGVKRVVVGGGVAANSRLREMLKERFEPEGIYVLFPSVGLCTDNGAMVAVTAYFHARRGLFSALDTRAFSRMVLR